MAYAAPCEALSGWDLIFENGASCVCRFYKLIWQTMLQAILARFFFKGLALWPIYSLVTRSLYALLGSRHAWGSLSAHTMHFLEIYNAQPIPAAVRLMYTCIQILVILAMVGILWR